MSCNVAVFPRFVYFPSIGRIPLDRSRLKVELRRYYTLMIHERLTHCSSSDNCIRCHPMLLLSRHRTAYFLATFVTVPRRRHLFSVSILCNIIQTRSRVFPRIDTRATKQQNPSARSRNFFPENLFFSRPDKTRDLCIVDSCIGKKDVCGS